ncbi:MAG TPA: dockerin type I domain-containing protein [Pirellulaceae bacterium]|nr:dockerin type I domain-containing protein [Pirellulaceae bacterium]
MLLERLEDRSLLASLPFGAMPDDTGEYMLGDVLVSVVLMESNNSLSPFDASTENWTPGLIAAVKSQIEEGLNWWSQSLDAMENVRDGLLTYTIDWTFAENPVQTGFEPITRPSTDFSLWVQDFLATAGFTQGSDFLANIRAFNNAQRLAHEKHWAFTIFVVNNAADIASGGDGRFAPGGFSRSFAYAGGNAFVMPADRPPSTVAHETGHMFWALDEYNRTAGSYSLRRGYYDTQNTNANPAPDYIPENSIMGSGDSVDAAYAASTSSTASLEMIGWKDSDSDGIFDVLDVNFSLIGSGRYDSSTGDFRFVGTSAVRTLENKNPSGLQNDITINEIRQAQYKFDSGDWQTAASYQGYEVDLDLQFSVPAGASTITMRTIDTRTGVTSDEYVYTLSGPPGQFTPGPGGGGYVLDDPDSDGWQDPGEGGLGGWLVGLVDPQGNAVNLRRKAEPNAFAEGLALSVFNTGAILTGIGGDVSSAIIRAQTSTSVPAAGRVFAVASALEGAYVDTFTSARRLKAEFQSPVNSVSIKAYGVTAGSVARLEAFDAQGNLLKRVTSKVLGHNASQKLSIDHPNIAYVVVKGHANTKVVLDDLEWGAISSTTTDALGAWTLPTLPEGEYRVAVTPKRFYGQTGPENGYHDIVVDADGVRGADFFFHRFPNPWRNDFNPLDVNQDEIVTARDALAVINWLNASGGAGGELPPEPELTDFLLDVSDDGMASPIDALLVINELNRRASEQIAGSQQGSSSTATTSTSSSSSSSSGEAEGEGLAELAGPALAAKYYATSPLHVTDIPGVDPTSGGCTCGQCQAINELALGLVGHSPAASGTEAELDSDLVGRKGKASDDDVHLDDSLLSDLAD